MNTSYTIRKKSVLYLLLENNRAMPAAGYAYAGYTKALEFRNGKSFRRVTEEGYSTNLVLETLLELLEYEGDPEREYSDCEFFRLHTAEALVNLGNTSILVRQTLHGLLYYSAYAINLEVAKILIYLGDTSEQIVQGLLAVLEEEDPWVRLDAAKVLLDLGNLSNLVVQTLQALMDDEDSEVCEKAAKVLELQGLPFHSQNF